MIRLGIAVFIGLTLASPAAPAEVVIDESTHHLGDEHMEGWTPEEPEGSFLEIGFALPASGTSGVLLLETYDVDLDHSPPYVDEVYWDGVLLGHLRDSNDAWVADELGVASELLTGGPHVLRIESDYDGANYDDFMFRNVRVEYTTSSLVIEEQTHHLGDNFVEGWTPEEPEGTEFRKVVQLLIAPTDGLISIEAYGVNEGYNNRLYWDGVWLGYLSESARPERWVVDEFDVDPALLRPGMHTFRVESRWGGKGYDDFMFRNVVLWYTPPGPPEGEAVLEVTPDVLLADGEMLAEIRLTLVTYDGDPVPGKWIEFYCEDLEVVFTQPEEPTDENGVAIGYVKSSEIGHATIKARIIGEGKR